MGKRKILSVAILSLFICASPVYAALIDRGTGMIYDTDLGITWLQTPNNSNLNWGDATAWAQNLSYEGYDDWRLPSAMNRDGSGPDSGWNCTGSEMGHLYYTELGNKGLSAPDGTNPQPGWGLNNKGPFSDLQLYDPWHAYTYWTNTEYEPDPSNAAWMFMFTDGLQSASTKGSDGGFHALAVRDGDFGPSVSSDSDYVANLTLGDTFSFDYFWLMGQEPDAFNLDILFLRDNTWQLLGGDINFDGSSTAWETQSLIVPENLRGLNTQIRFSVLDVVGDTDPTVYLRNVASNGTAPVPEPATMLLLGAGLVGLAGFRKKLRR